MSETVAVVTPAYRAERWIGACVRSVLAQSYPHWQHWIIADDGADYEALLAAEGLRDPRLRFLSSGTRRWRGVAGPQCRARPDRRRTTWRSSMPTTASSRSSWSRRSPRCSTTPSSRWRSTSSTRPVGGCGWSGQGPDGELAPAVYKWTCLSMDSMMVWDRRKTDARYDLELTNMTDLEFLLQLYRTVPAELAPRHAAARLSQAQRVDEQRCRVSPRR